MLLVFALHHTILRFLLTSDQWNTSWRKSAGPFLSGHLNPHDSKKVIMRFFGPWYTTFSSPIKIISSKRSYVSGAGWRSETSMVYSEICANCWRQETIWKVVELSNPVDISSIKSTLHGPTIISPDCKTSSQGKKNINIHHWINLQLTG